MDNPQSIDNLLQQALSLHQSGQLGQAEKLYRQVLAADPRQPDALHLLGILAGQAGQNAVAVELISRSLAIKPDDVSALSNLGNFSIMIGRCEEAANACRRALQIDPSHTGALNNLGNALRELGKENEAVEYFNRALAINPNYTDAYNNRGMTLARLGKREEAIADYRKAMALDPSATLALNNLGNALRDQGNLDEAIDLLRRVIARSPGFPEAQYNLGNALNDKGKLEEAIECYQRAIALRPTLAQAYSNLGGALHKLRRDREALAAFDRAAQLQPDYADAHNNRGILLHDMGRLEEAALAFHRSIQIAPNAKTFWNLGNVLHDLGRFDESIAALKKGVELSPEDPGGYLNLGVVFAAAGRTDEAVDQYRIALQLQPDFPAAYNNLGAALKDAGAMDEALAAFKKAHDLDAEFYGALSNYVYTLAFHPDYDAKRIGQEARNFARLHETFDHIKLPQPVEHDRLRIGYLSPDFCQHVVGRNLLPLMEHHDHSRFEIFCYSNTTRPDALTRAMQSHADHWVDIVRQSDQQAAEKIAEDRIDILVDLTLHMSGARPLIFARKPAPVQLTYLGYCGTTGLSAIDYRFSDPYMDPPGLDESVYSEKTIRLPRTYWCYCPAPVPDVSPAPMESRGFVTFGCMNNFAKVSRASLELWAKLMAGVPSSRMIIHAANGKHRDHVLKLFADQQVDPARIEFVGKETWEPYIKTYDRIDISLDPFPYGGGITTCDSLWMGVPVVTLRGGIAVGRGGVSILSNIGLPELVADSPEQFIHIAQKLANDPGRRRELRGSLRGMMRRSPLMDSNQFARDVESAYAIIWAKSGNHPIISKTAPILSGN